MIQKALFLYSKLVILRLRLTLDNQPLKSGFYQLKNKDQVIKNIAFNYDRSESDLIIMI